MSKSNKHKRRVDGSKAYRKTIRINGKPEQATFTRLEDANKWYSEKLRQRELYKHGINSTIEQMRFSEFSEKWLEKRKKSGKPTSSWKVDARRLREYYIPLLEYDILSRIEPAKWEKILNKVADDESLSNATFNRHRSLIHKLYNDAIKKYKTAVVNPITAIEKRHEGTSESWDYFSTKEEIQRYLDEAQRTSLSVPLKKPFSLFALIALNTGARVSEILDLRHGDFYIPQRRIKISTIYDSDERKSCDRTKSKKGRWVGINDRLLEEYEKYKKETKFQKNNDLVICDELGQHIQRWAIYRTHKAVCKRAELKPLRVHDLRHTFASHWVMNGGSLEDLKEVLGHSVLQVTAKYAHLSPDHLALKANTVSF